MGASGRRPASSVRSRASRCCPRQVVVAPRLLAEPVEELGQRVVVRVGVLADVEDGQVQPERGHRADDPVHPPAGGQLPAVVEQRVAHQLQVGQQTRRTEVVVSRLVGSAGGDAHAGVLQPLLDAPPLEAVGLAGVDAPDAFLDLRQSLEVGGDALQQGIARADQLRRGGQVLHQVVHEPGDVADRVSVLQDEHVGGDVGRHGRVAVAVATDPGAELQRRRGRGQVDPQAGQLLGEVLEHVTDGVQHQLVEVVGRVARLVERLRPVLPQLVGLPQQVDDLGDAPVGAALVTGL